MSLLLKGAKYTSVGQITLRNHFAYVVDFLVRSIFLLIILYIFMQLWQVTFQGEGSSLIAGYSFKQMIWYLIFTESMTLACPSVCNKVEEEVKSGDVAYRLTRPVSYIGFHYMAFMSEVAVRFSINLTIGTVLGILVLGLPDFGYGWLAFFLVAAFGFTINFMLNMALALSAFWVEETRGLEFVYNKLLFTIGGMLMPLEIFPETMQRICHWLPFQTVLYFPAKTAVHYDGSKLLTMLGIQCIWLVIMGLVVVFIYSRGVKKLNVNGG
ncbi:ABC transporter permease [Paenibacillus psychroresistens]|uniref:ABC transporter permease n=1 Tax=Paenibacillus psychroresistens TaxID=1778678 RepID=A0A6B8RIY7_9BACL|nr:ABC-2 family transporter protein [Paenibacillus psychroresistens]QGQ96019.1 ABC transporter permease [Paenibacillus psychroresistens]